MAEKGGVSTPGVGSESSAGRPESAPPPELTRFEKVAREAGTLPKVMTAGELAAADDLAKRIQDAAAALVASDASALSVETQSPAKVTKTPKPPKVPKPPKLRGQRGRLAFPPLPRRDSGRRAERLDAPAMTPRVLALRAVLATVLAVTGLVVSTILAVGALLVAVDAPPVNLVVELVTDAADALAGPFRHLFTFDGADGADKSRLVNWGIAALVYLAASRVVSAIVR